MPPQQRYRLQLSKLQFCSLVDEPAQPNAKTLLIKRRGKRDEIAASARFVKSSDELGLAFFWAFTTTNADGSDHFDLQGDNIGEDFVKAAMEFMTEHKGAVDEMHDGVPTAGRVVFAMPMTPDIAKAYGLVTKQSGLMIAIKPTADQLAKLKTGEYTGVSIAGLGERLPVGKSRSVAKQVIMTDLVDGHQHAIDLDDPADWCGDRLSTTWATSEGADQQHCHVWTFDGQTGVVSIGADSGHTHVVSEPVPAAVLAVFALNEQVEAKETATDVLERVLDGDSVGAGVAVTIAARALVDKSTPVAPVRTVKTQPEPKPMNYAKMLAAILALSATEQAHVAAMPADEIEPFFAKSASERSAILKSAAEADAVVFKGEVSGIEVRKSDGAKMLELAKNSEATAATLAKREAEISKAEVRKIATEVLGGMPGDDETHDFIIASLRKGGDEVKTQRALETLKGMRAETKIGKNPPGINGTDTPVAVTKRAAYQALEKGLLAFCVEKSIPSGDAWLKGFDLFAKTDIGAALLKAHDEIKAA
jgi:hypothetical protein